MNRPERNASNLAIRVASAAIGIPLVLAVNFAGGWIFGVVVGIVAAIGAWEAARLLSAAGSHPLYIVVVPAAVVLALAPAWNEHPQSDWVGILVLCFALLGAYSLLPHAYTSVGPVWLYGYFPLVYAGLLLGYLHLLRHAHSGAWWVFVVFLMTWAYDTGAFAAGSMFGRRPFMHHVSPNKTVEGVIGGLTLSSLAGLAGIPGIGLAFWQALLLGLVTGVVAQLGDLIQSMFKRQSGVKDSGTLIPGHGGLLDRIDSLLLTGVFGYYASTLLGHAS